MKSLHRMLFAVLGLVVFGLAFLAGFASPGITANTGDTGGADDSGDNGITLPADVQSRLVHLAPVSASQDFRPATTFWEVLGKVKTRYVDKITDQDRLTHGAVASMLRALRDPYSRIIKPEQLKLDEQQALGDFDGIGVILGARLSGKQVPVASESATSGQPGPPRRPTDTPDRAWQLVVVDTIPGSAAAQAGVRTGDIVSRINGDRIDRAPLSTRTIDDLNVMLNSSSVHTASLTVARAGNANPVEVHIDHAQPVKEQAVEARMLQHETAYAHINLLTPTAGTEFIQNMTRLAPSHPTSLVLDLRDNPGGSVTSAVEVLGALEPGGPEGILQTHNGSKKLAPTQNPPAFSFNRIVVLVNAGTANTAEMVAGSLHEHKGVVLEGAPTFGNGLVQTVYPIGQGWAYSLTTGCLQTAKGLDFNQNGLAVDRPIGPNILQGDILSALPSLLAEH